MAQNGAPSGHVGRKRGPNEPRRSMFGDLGLNVGACGVARVPLRWPRWRQEAPDGGPRDPQDGCNTAGGVGAQKPRVPGRG